MTSPTPAPKPSSTPAPKPNPVPVPAPKPNPVPVPAPTPPKCIYNPSDSLALEMRKVINAAPSACKTDISNAFNSYLYGDSFYGIPFQVSTVCKAYVVQVINNHVNYNLSTACMRELSSDLAEYNRTYVGNVINYLPSKGCVAYINSFMHDFFTHPTDSAHMVGCNSSLSVVVSPH